jgi:hypothetical protein
MKSLTIKSNNCLLNKKTYGGVSINDMSIGNLIVENLPEGLQDYKDYPVKLSLQIEFFGEDDLSVTTEGYEVVKKEENNESEVEE